MTFAAAIFDFDGTLVDTMPLHYESYRRVFAEMGLELDPAHFYATIGGKATETIPKFLRGRPAPLSIEEIHQKKKTALAMLLDSGAHIPVLETAKLVPVMRAHMKVGLASSGSRAGIDQMLARLGWTSWFEAIVTAEDARHGKPAPDLFLITAERLGVAPKDCLVFEDTDAGVGAATAAGMSWFDVRKAVAPTSLPGSRA